MAQAITIYRSNDGKLFATNSKADRWNELIAVVREAMEPLGVLTRDQKRAMEGGRAYHQHDPATVLQVKTRIIELVKRNMLEYAADSAHSWMFDPTIPMSRNFLGRIIDDTDSGSPLGLAFQRLACIDSEGREWDQVYYVEYPSENAEPV